MKKTLLLFIAALMTAALAITLPLSAAEPAYANVVLNGKSVTYSDPLARPQIINSRTMVPFRDYAETLGIVIGYSDATKTMTFNKNGMSFSHVAGTMAATINGVEKNYDTPSMNINGYTMMPITMLLDAINAEYKWDDSTKTLNITTKTAEPPLIRNVSAASTSVKLDELITLYITSNLYATHVKVQNSAGAILAQVTESASDSNGRYYTASFFSPAAGSQLFTIYGGNESGFNSSFSAIGIAVEEPIQLKILDIALKKTTVDEGDEVVATIETSTDVVRVEIENQDGDRVARATKALYQGAQLYEWELRFDAEDGTGNVGYDVYVFNANGKESNSYFRVKVNGNGSSSSSSAPQITKVSFDDDISKGDTVAVTVRTNKKVGSVYVLDKNKDEKDYLDRLTKYTSSGSSYYEWELDFDADYKGYYYIYAYDSKKAKYDYERISIDFDGGSSASSGSAAISSIAIADKSNIKEGDRVTITVKTNKNVGSVTLFDEDDKALKTVKSYSSSGSYYSWEIKIYPDYEGDYYIRAYDADDSKKYDEEDFEIIYTKAAPEIEDWQVKNEKKIDEGDNVTVTVETNTVATEVVIYYKKESNANRVARKTSPTKKYSSYYLWELEIKDIENEGTYYIYAYNKDDDNDYQKVTINFR